MSYRIETRLAVVVSILAICAVAATALAIREGARTELSKARVFRTSAASAPSAARANTVAAALRGHCCPISGVDASSLLEEDEVAFIYAPDSDQPLARFDRLRTRVPTLDLKRSPSGVIVDARVETDFTVRQVRLSIAGPGAPVNLGDGRTGALYLFHVPANEETVRATVFLTGLDRRVLAIALIAAAIAVVLTWITARRIFNPLRELDRAVRDIGEGNLDRRVAVSGAGEIATLERRFNAMAEELSRQQQLRRNLASDVAHELRAPLTAVRCRLEAQLDGLSTSTPATLESMRDDIAHLGRLVDDLQDLAHTEAKEIRLQCAPIAVEPLLRSAVRAAGLEGDARLRLDIAPGLEVYADEMRIRQVVVNLLTNADRHTPQGGSIVIRSATEGDSIVTEVRNSGSALDEEQLARVFDRFYRTDPARQRSTGGTGLGLAIVKGLVEAHRGRVWARSDGEGVVFGFSIHRNGESGVGI